MESLMEIQIIDIMCGIMLFFLPAAIVIGGYAAILFFLIHRIPDRKIRVVTPPILAIAIAFIALMGEYTGLSYLQDQMIHITILALGVITPFQLIYPRLKMKKKWIVVIAYSVVSFLLYTIVSYGRSPSNPIYDSIINYFGLFFRPVSELCSYVEILLVAVAVCGFFLLVGRTLAWLNSSRLRHLPSPARVLVTLALTPFLFLASYVYILFLLFQAIPWKERFLAPPLIAIVLVITGTFLNTVDGIFILINPGLLVYIILSLAIVTPFPVFPRYLDRKQKEIAIVLCSVITQFSLVWVGSVFGPVFFQPPDLLAYLVWCGAGVAIATVVYGFITQGVNELKKRFSGKTGLDNSGADVENSIEDTTGGKA